MVSDQIIIGSDGTGMKEALAEAERVVRYYELPKKDALKIRLLTEETISMMRTFTDGVEAAFRIETEGRECFRIHVRMNTRVDNATRKQLIALSTSGENEAAKGFIKNP